MNKKKGVLIGCLLISMLLARVTGVAIHIALASLFVIVIGKHAIRKKENSSKIDKKWQQVNRILYILLMIIIGSGAMMAIETIFIYGLIIHKVASILFLVFILLHCKQHILYWKIKKGNVK